jgi:hypothetical protein
MASSEDSTIAAILLVSLIHRYLRAGLLACQIGGQQGNADKHDEPGRVARGECKGEMVAEWQGNR